MIGRIPNVSVKKDKIDIYRRDALEAASIMLYGDDIISRIKNAKTEIQISNALRDGRLSK